MHMVESGSRSGSGSGSGSEIAFIASGQVKSGRVGSSPFSDIKTDNNLKVVSNHCTCSMGVSGSVTKGVLVILRIWKVGTKWKMT